MAKPKLLLSAGFLFVSGVALGIVISPLVMRDHFFRPPFGPPESPKEALINHLESELHLSSEQRRQLLPIVEGAVTRLDQLRLSNLPKIEALIEDATKEAQEFLTEEQRRRLYQLEILAKQHFRRTPNGPIPPPPPPNGGHFPPEP